MTTDRPDPDALLRRLEPPSGRTAGGSRSSSARRPASARPTPCSKPRGCAGAEGVDVVIGWVETHGRAETAALAEGLERLPRADGRVPRRRHCASSTSTAALRRKPGLLLLDELAHTNAPGLRHAKRWQDVEDLLRRGIDVYTTLNVQHLESLNDLVNRITGIDGARDRARPRARRGRRGRVRRPARRTSCCKRLARGQGLPARARRARRARSFFRRGNLLALRELALRRTAEHVDADVRDYRRDHEIEATWPVAERILVCVRPNPESDRAGARRAAHGRAAAGGMDRGLRREPGAAAADARPSGQPRRHAEAGRGPGRRDRDACGATASARRCSRSRASATSAASWWASRCTPRWRDRLRGSLLDEIVRGSGGIEVVVIPGGRRFDEAPRSAAAPPAAAGRPFWADLLPAIAVVAACTLVCWPMLGRFATTDLVMVYLLGVALLATLLAARLGAGRGAGRRRLRFLLRAAVPDVRGAATRSYP